MDLFNVNFKQYMIVFRDLDNFFWYVLYLIFWIVLFFFLFWFLRVIIEYKIVYVYYYVQKVFGINYVENDIEFMFIMCVNIMGSFDLEVLLQNNYIVLSYFEVLLMLFGRIIEILDVNGNVLRIKYGVMRSEMFVVFLFVINEKDFFLRRI